MALCMTPPKEQLSIKECRELLDIQTRDTINEYLKILGLNDRKSLTWNELKQIIQLQSFLGLRPGKSRKQEYCDRTPKQLAEDFASYGVDIEQRFKHIQAKYFNQ